MKTYNFLFLFKIARNKKKVESSGNKIEELVPKLGVDINPLVWPCIAPSLITQKNTKQMMEGIKIKH